MQNGNLRADVNVSVCRPGQYEKYQETTGFRPSRHPLRDQEHELAAVHPGAIDFEARRQIAILEGRGVIVQKAALTIPKGDDAVHAVQGRGA